MKPRADIRTTPLVFASAVLALSGHGPYERATRAMEAAPVAVALPLPWAACRRIPPTTLLNRVIFVHAPAPLSRVHDGQIRRLAEKGR